MKKNLFMVATVALMAMVSCNKMDDNNGIDNSKPSYFVEFTAEAANEGTTPAHVQTRTIYDQANKKTLWEKTDAISVNGKKFEIADLSEDNLSARFVNVEELGADFGEPYFAVYPYSSELSFDATTVSGIVVDSTPELDTKGSNVAIAYQASGNTLSFKNVTSMIRFSVDMDDVTEVEISSNNGSAIAGAVEVSWNNGEPEVQTVTEGSASIVLEGNFVKGTKYYVNVLPQTLETGVTIRLNGIIAKTKKSSVTLGRSKVMVSEGLKLEESGWTITGDFTDNGLSTWDPAGGIKMYKEDNAKWYVAKNVSMKENGGADYTQFKITNGSWDKAYRVDNLAVGKWQGAAEGGGNAWIPKGVYDIYYNYDKNIVLTTPPGSKALTVYLSWQDRPNLWFWSEESEIANDMSVGWPGSEGMTETIDGWGYYKWMVVIPAANWGQSLKFIFNKDGNELHTKNFQKITDAMFYNGENGDFLK